jgi:hypothetical protein
MIRDCCQPHLPRRPCLPKGRRHPQSQLASQSPRTPLGKWIPGQPWTSPPGAAFPRRWRRMKGARGCAAHARARGFSGARQPTHTSPLGARNNAVAAGGHLFQVIRLSPSSRRNAAHDCDGRHSWQDASPPSQPPTTGKDYRVGTTILAGRRGGHGAAGGDRLGALTRNDPSVRSRLADLAGSFSLHLHWRPELPGAARKDDQIAPLHLVSALHDLTDRSDGVDDR